MQRRVLLVGTMVLLLAVFLGTAVSAESLDGRRHELVQIAEFNVPEANQGIGVDENYFYAVDNTRIAKYDKRTGEFVAMWEGPKDTFLTLPSGERRLTSKGPIIHLDSGVIVNGLLYCSHSNWPVWPMTSSVEVWNPVSMEHIMTYSFGIRHGSFTWLDRYAGFWWGTFANYDRPQGEGGSLYGNKRNTTVVRMDDTFQVLEAWILPDELLEKFETMSNSGGSWGPDGFLYLSGHDPAEVYRCRLPKAGSIIELVEIIPMNIRGQGIAWDRSEPGILYGIIRATSAERAAGITHKVTVHKLVEIKD